MYGYGCAAPDLCNDFDRRLLSANAKRLEKYLATCPHKIIWRKLSLPEKFICDDLLVDKKSLRKALKELVNLKCLKAELKYGLLFIEPEFLDSGFVKGIQHK